MVYDRPYKTARDHAEALHELRKNAGTQFDPQVVGVFCVLYADGVPPDGLEEVHSLHQRAQGGLQRLEPRAAAALLGVLSEGTGRVHQHEHDDHAPTRPKGMPRAKRGSSAAEARATETLDEAAG